MDSVSFLRHLDRELGAFRSCLGGDLSVRVPTCGDWTLHDLAEHLGNSGLYAAAAVTEGHGDLAPAPAPRDPHLLLEWYDETVATLLDALDADPATPAWVFHPPGVIRDGVGFWQRRRGLETLVHRWDAQSALGAARPLDPELAGEGVAEVFDTMAPRQIARGRARLPRHALRLDATDTGACWSYGQGPPVAAVAASAEDLLLMLWGRRRADGPEFTWKGDRGARLAVLAGPLVPCGTAGASGRRARPVGSDRSIDVPHGRAPRPSACPGRRTRTGDTRTPARSTAPASVPRGR